MFGRTWYGKVLVIVSSICMLAFGAAVATAGTGEPGGGTPGPTQKVQTVSPSLNSDVTFSAVFPHYLDETGVPVLLGDPADPNAWPSKVAITGTGQCNGKDVSFGPGTDLWLLPSYKLPNGSTYQINIGNMTAAEIEKYFWLTAEGQVALACYPPPTISYIAFYVAPISVTEFQRFVNVPVDTGIPNMIVKAKIVWKGVLVQ